MSSMDESEHQRSNQEWDEPMSPSPHDPGSAMGPASPDPMSPDGFDGEEPMSPDNSRSYDHSATPDCPMSPEDGACSEGSTRSEDDQGRLRGPATPEGPASPDGSRSDNYARFDGPRSPDDDSTDQDGPRSPDDFQDQDGPRSPDDFQDQEGPRSPDDHSSPGGPRSPDEPSSPGGPRSPDDVASRDGPRSPDDYDSQGGPRSPTCYPTSLDGARSPDEMDNFGTPRSPGSAASPDGPRSPDGLASCDGPRSPEGPASFNDSASIDGSRTFDGQSSAGGPRTPEYPGSPHGTTTPDGHSEDNGRPMTHDDDPANSLLGGFTSQRSLSSPAPSNPRSPAESGEHNKNDDQDDRLSEISEGDSALNGELSNEDGEQKDNQEEDGCIDKIDARSNGKSKRRSDDSLGLRDELDFEAERESGEEDGEEGEEGEEGETPKKKRDVENREEGELSDEEDDDSLLRQEPKTVCRFFNKGQCTWGTNCRFLHPGVSDKGNYNMFAPSKPQANADKEEETTERERPREVRRFIPEPSPFESAWERGLRYAKEMMKRANKRKETDADFEEKRFNLSLGQAELDRENDYYTRPASPVYKQPDEIADQYLDPYEKQAIRHFRGGHFENFEVRYHVDPRYNIRGGGTDRSRREKFEREVSERSNRRSRHAPPGEERSRIWQDDRYMEVVSTAGGGTTTRSEAEAWADPWARRKTPPHTSRKKKTSRTRSYSTGSSSHSSSRSSHSSSYSSRSRSRSNSKSSKTSIASRSSRSRSSSRTPSPSRRRGNHRVAPGSRISEKSGLRSMPPIKGGRPMPPTGPHTRPPIPRRPVEPRDPRMLNIPRRPETKTNRMDTKERMLNIPRRPESKTNKMEDKERMLNMLRRPEIKPNKMEDKERMLNIPRRPEAKTNKMDAIERMLNIPRRPDPKMNKMDTKERLSSPPPPPPRQEIKAKVTASKRVVPPPVDIKPPKVPLRERLDRFGRIRKDASQLTFSRSRSRSRSRGRAGRTFSSSRSRSRSSTGSSRSRSRTRSPTRSRTRSRSHSSSSHSSSASSVDSRRKASVKRRLTQGTVSYGQSKSKAMDPMKLSGQKQQIKLTLKGPAVRRLDKPVLPQEDDSGESDTGIKISKRKPDTPPHEPPPAKIVARSPPPVLALPPQIKKPQANRREELLKQLRAVEDAIARKRTKLPT